MILNILLGMNFLILILHFNKKWWVLIFLLFLFMFRFVFQEKAQHPDLIITNWILRLQSWNKKLKIVMFMLQTVEKYNYKINNFLFCCNYFCYYNIVLSFKAYMIQLLLFFVSLYGYFWDLKLLMLLLQIFL